MLVGQKIQSVGDRIRYHVDCSSWLAIDEGESLVSVVATVDSGPAICDGVLVDGDKLGFHYYVSNGSLDDQFNVIFEQTTSRAQVRYDHVQFNIVTNGGPASSAGNLDLMISILGPTGATGPGGVDGGTNIFVDDGAPPSGGTVGQEILVGEGPP